MLAAGRVISVMCYPPGLKPGSSAAAGSIWEHCWHVLTAGPVRALFAPGSFMRSYALLTVPALGVAAVAGVALLARSPLADIFKKRWRSLLGWTMGLLSLALAEDALRRHLLPGRLFLGSFRGALAAVMGFGGAVLVAGPESDDGFSGDQIGEWITALWLFSLAAVSGSGGGTLIHAALTLQSPADTVEGAQLAHTGANGAATNLAAERLAFTVYGSGLLLAAAVSLAAYTGLESVWRLASGLVNVLDAVLQLRWMARGVVDACRWIGRRKTLQTAWGAFLRVDKAVTTVTMASLKQGFRGLQQAWLLTRDWVLLPARTVLTWALRSVVTPAFRSVGKAARRTGKEIHQRLLLPAAHALAAGARFTYNRVLRPAAATAARIARDYAAPVLWPAGSAAAVYWFTEHAVSTLYAGGTGALMDALPYGVASYVSIVSLALIAGKAMRRTPGSGVLFRRGTALESAAVAAYLHLDLGLGTLAARVLRRVYMVAVFVAVSAVATGHYLIALLTGPLVAALWAALSAAWLVLEAVARVLGPVIEEMCHGVKRAVKAIWKRPELSLLLAAGVLAAAFGAHKSGLTAALARLGFSLASAAAKSLYGLLAALVSPVWALASRLGLKAASLMGSTAGAGASALASWGGRAAGDVSSIFASASFAGVFAGLHMLHALLLRVWVVSSLESEGLVGSAALTPIVSFVARSTCKVALAPAYLAALASLLAGQAGSGLAAKLAAAGTPVLWVAYLIGLWFELARRVYVSHDPRRRSSEFAEALKALRDARATEVAGELRAQAPPRRVFESDTCAVCLEPMDMKRLVHTHDGIPVPRTTAGPTNSALEERAAAEAEQEAVAVLRCGHMFHEECAALWLARETRCPLCREPAVGPSRHANALF
ncbi:hypothetical protein HYH03_004793 [Edaphochlamys debaryana]|uniref:RING-type domain-containing protein n=1 Tax=Edaphochlamys debaryana TaxID=47281 RepID=A0A835Y8Q9_9CHLO|nr:hypothetical protein HYH03_004793 [Edaphochlamys debaryana]|eukprot:KAG2497204.1 hypothetical protein HYH03_004793 [Edaphochlamys debaryana]